MVITRVIISNYIKNYLPELEKDKVAEMVEEVRNMYLLNIKQNLIDLTKEYLKQKGDEEK